ncbi:MAG: anti-sigma factor antagonist [Clostridia bacterium]|nr:anti-sigma factor antagonist [Clostridia bacterium]
MFYRSGNILVIKVAGELDHHSADTARRSMDREIMKIQTKHVVFDFSDLSFMDSSGIGMLMGRYREVKMLGGNSGIILKRSEARDRYGMPALSSMERILDMSGVFKCMTRFDNLETAVAGIGG